MEGFMQTSKRFLPIRALKNFLFPPSCAECGALIVEDVGVCAQCWQNISYIEKPLCDQMGVPFEYDPGGALLSATALASPPPYRRARFVASYDEVARSLVQKMKYRDQTYLGKFMGGLMVKFGTELIKDSDVILPVPLHRRRLFMRRFNQASLLADDIAARSHLPVEHLILTRKLPTRSQIGLSAKERRKNVAKAFETDPQHRHTLKDKRVLLIDDVVTTGSTIEACTKTLLRAGVCHVNILAFARVTDRVKTL